MNRTVELEGLLKEVKAIDLSKPPSTNKVFDESSGDILIGSLTEHQQRIHRLVQASLDTIEEILQKGSEAFDSHYQSHIEGTPHDCAEYRELMSEYRKNLASHIMRYHAFRSIFLAEIARDFPNAQNTHKILGVRNCNILIGRNDNNRRDVFELLNSLLPQSAVVVELSITKSDSSLTSDEKQNVPPEDGFKWN